MSKIAIDRDIPKPNKRRRNGKSKYPWEEMKVGDSFAFPHHIQKKSAYSFAYQAGKKYNAKFEVETVEGGIRCWRME